MIHAQGRYRRDDRLLHDIRGIVLTATVCFNDRNVYTFTEEDVKGEQGENLEKTGPTLDRTRRRVVLRSELR
jgi:hypothetical protein